MKNPIIVNELKRLTLEHGGTLQPRAVVDAARAEESPLHAQFDWDDSTAAEKHRLWQARQLISVVVTYESAGNGKTIACPVFVSLSSDRQKNGEGYRLVTTVLTVESQRMQMLADARQDMLRFKEKYKTLSELAAVFAAMEGVELPLEKAS